MIDITKGHTLHAFDDDLAQLRGLVLEMGEIVIAQVRDAVDSLGNRDPQLAESVVEKDRQVDQLDMEANEEIEKLFAVRQPVASDLRLVLALSKVVSELARAGNKAKKVANFTLQFEGEEARAPGKKLMHHVRRMSERACQMLEHGLEALTRLDVQAAVGLIKEDDELDEEFDASMRHLVTFMWDSPATITKVLDMVFVLKALERIGDHANHIAQQVIFVVEGKDVRYVSPEILESKYSAG